MRIENVGRRGTLFTFEEPESALGEYSCYLIEGTKRFYLCDTHLGPRSMAPIQKHMAAKAPSKPLVIFYSHSDWDHIWGACAFADALVVAQERCAHFVRERGVLELARYNSFQNGIVELVTPDLVFENRLTFLDDEIDFIFTPGHTADSACCRDRKDNVLYVGDLIERPQPMIGWHDIEAYIATLESLAEQEDQTLISSHSGIVSPEDIAANLDYLHECLEQFSSNPRAAAKENALYKLYILLLYEDAIAQAAGKSFDYTSFQRQLWSSLNLDYIQPLPTLLAQTEYEVLKLALETQLADL